MGRARFSAGQSTVELAMVLPVVLILVLVTVQVGLVARDQVVIHHAVREAARSAALDPNQTVAVDAAAGSARSLSADRLAVDLTGGTTTGDLLTVRLRYSSPTEVPVVGRFIGDVTVSAEAVVRVE